MKTAFFLSLLAACVLADGPRVSILGDSYSTFEGSIPEGNAIWYTKNPPRNGIDGPDKTWWSLVIQALGGTLEKNEAWSGSTVCNIGYGGKDSTVSSFVTRFDRLGDPDVILVCGATNDSWANSPIGEYKYSGWTTGDLNSFRPALARLFAGLRETYPAALTVFILNDCLKAEINDSVHEICGHYDVPCVDLRGITKGAGHPDVGGMRAIADQTAAVVKPLLEARRDKNPASEAQLRGISACFDKTGVFFLATVDGDQPKLRPLGAHHLVDGKLLFGVGEFKNVYKQLAKNPKTEIVALDAASGRWLRYTGRAVFEREADRARYEEIFLDAAPGLRKVYDKTPGKRMMIFHLQDATAELIATMPPGQKIL